MTANELAESMEIRASIRRKATSRKSVQEGASDRLADQLEEAATMLRQQQDKLTKYELRHAEQRKRIDELETMLRQQQAEIEALKKEMWMTEVNIQQQTLAHIIKLLTIQHDTLACTSYPMSKENREAIKK